MAFVVAIVPGVGILGALAVLAVLFGKAPAILAPVVGLIPSRKRVREALRAGAERHGVNPDWPDAIGWVESQWKQDAVGDDGESLGPTQIRRRTLAQNGYQGDPEALLRDPDLAADWTARLLLPGSKNAEGVTLKDPLTSLAQVAGWWNAGKPDRPPPAYLAKLESAMERVTVV